MLITTLSLHLPASDTWPFKNLSKMAYVIDENCVACGTCKAGCPVDAISEGDIFVIDPDVCISCGTCAENCPAGAISEG